MIRESYLANIRRLPSDALKVIVTASVKSPLAPSWSLIKAWHAKPRLLTWREYETRYRREIREKPEALALLQEIKTISESKDVYLICYEKRFPCHRFILLDMLREPARDVDSDFQQAGARSAAADLDVQSRTRVNRR